MTISKEKFKAYETVRQSGVTNMFDVSNVIKYANQFSDVALTKKDCLDIMKNYSTYREKYK